MGQFRGIDVTVHRELFRVTDQMRRLRTNPRSLTVSDHGDILTDACNAISSSLAEDLALALAFTERLANDPNTLKQARDVARDMRTFAAFLAFEQKTLVECGVAPETAMDIASQLGEIRVALVQMEGFEGANVLPVVEKFKDSVCRAAADADNRLRSEQDVFENGQRTLITYGIGLTLANAVAAVISAGVASFALLSGAAGGAMLAGTGLLKDPGRRAPGSR